MDCAKALVGGGFSCRLQDGNRLHLQHGPIDLILRAQAKNMAEIDRAYDTATRCFVGLLESLALEIDELRQPLTRHSNFQHPIAQRMSSAVAAFQHSAFVTPMAAVAGSVADYIKNCVVQECSLDQLLVNNGGDIALHLNSGEKCKFGICTDVRTNSYNDTVTLQSDYDVSGIATSGWQGRSHSMGIANAVTVLAESAALADVAATLIANAVDLDESSKVHRVPAVELSPDSDLGNRPVTVGVDRLSGREKQQALKGGLARAEGYMQRGLIAACYLNVQSYSASVSGIAPISLSSQRVGMKRVSLSHNSVAAENYWT